MDEEKLRVIDMHGQFAYWADEQEARRLFRMGYGHGAGSKKKIHEIHLVVPLAVAAEVDAATNRGVARDLTGLPRDRYHFRDYDLTMGWKLRKIDDWQLPFFGPMTARLAYLPVAKPKRGKKSAVVTHDSHKKGRRR